MPAAQTSELTQPDPQRTFIRLSRRREAGIAPAPSRHGDVLGVTRWALRARSRLFQESHVQGRWLDPETTEPHWQPAVRRAIAAYRRDKRELLFAAFAEVHERRARSKQVSCGEVADRWCRRQ